MSRTHFTPRPPYPPDWCEIAEAARARAGHKCVRCGLQGLTPDEYDDWDAPGNKERIIEVHHVDGNPANCEDDNLQPLCKPCHLRRHRIMRAQRRVSAEDSAGQRSMLEYGWNSTVID